MKNLIVLSIVTSFSIFAADITNVQGYDARVVGVDGPSIDNTGVEVNTILMYNTDGEPASSGEINGTFSGEGSCTVPSMTVETFRACYTAEGLPGEKKVTYDGCTGEGNMEYGKGCVVKSVDCSNATVTEGECSAVSGS